MQSTRHLAVDIDKTAAFLTMIRPPVNALDPVMIAELHTTLEALDAREEVGVVVLQSSHPVFCAGADLATVASFLEDMEPDTALKRYARSAQALIRRFEAMQAATVCAISGAAMGGGLELALAADFRIAGHKAKFGLPELSLGLIPAAGGTQRLARLVGMGVARQMILLGAVLDAQQALVAHLVDEVHAADDLAARVRDFVARLGKQPPKAVHAAKQCLAFAQATSTSGFDSEVEEIGRLLVTSDTRARIEAFLHRASKG